MTLSYECSSYTATPYYATKRKTNHIPVNSNDMKLPESCSETRNRYMEVHFRFFRIKKAGMYKTLSSIVFMSLIVCSSVSVSVSVRHRSGSDYSTVTDLARFLGQSTSNPRSTARWKDSSCRGMTLRIPCRQSTL